MISKKEKTEPSAEMPLPNSHKVYVDGKLHSDLRVPSIVILSEVEESLTIYLIT